MKSNEKSCVNGDEQPSMFLGAVGLGRFVAETAPQIVPSFMEGVGSGVHNVWSAFSAPPPGKPVESQPEIQLSF